MRALSFAEFPSRMPATSGVALQMVATLLLAGALRAQTVGSVRGVVIAGDSAPVAQARVTIIGTSFSAITARDGAFYVAGVPQGHHRLDVRMVGYAPTVLPMDVRTGETLYVHATLMALDPLPLTAVEVNAAIPAPLLGFEERRARGPGTFFTRDALERMRPRLITDVLRRVPGLQVRPVNGAYGDNLLVTSRGGRCPVMFYVNGTPFPISNDMPINHFIAAHEVVALEVYSASEIPPQFNSSMYTARCGLVGIWTRSGK